MSDYRFQKANVPGKVWAEAFEEWLENMPVPPDMSIIFERDDIDEWANEISRVVGEMAIVGKLIMIGVMIMRAHARGHEVEISTIDLMHKSIHDDDFVKEWTERFEHSPDKTDE